MTHLTRGDADLHYPNGEHRGTPASTNGTDLENYERRIRAHLESHAAARASHSAEDPFPMEWHAWRQLWRDYLSRQLAAGTFKYTSYRIAGTNVLVDESLGVWEINGQNVELAEVRFGLGDPSRAIGITVAGPGGTRGLVTIASSFADLERMLGYGNGS